MSSSESGGSPGCTVRVGVFTLGGTIAMVPTGDAGVTPQLRAGELLAAVPGLGGCGIGVELHDVRQLPGASLRFEDILGLLEVIEGRLGSGDIQGAVVTQGTDTLEETSWLLDLLHTEDAPIVVTGAMRNPAQAGADGPANLLNAVQIAADPQARGLGVLVVFSNEIHRAGAVRKTHSTSVSAFTSLNGGPIGYVSESDVTIWHRPTRLRRPITITPDAGAALARTTVGLVVMTLGQDDTIVRAVGSSCQGLVIAGFGVGHVPIATVEALSDLAGKIPVVLASRAGAGPVATRTYGFPGSESDLLARGLIRAGYLDPYKARILLQVLIATGTDNAHIREAFAHHGGYTAPPVRQPGTLPTLFDATENHEATTDARS